MSSQPNILFITLDQWRADALDAPEAGRSSARVRTPSLAALARDATVFTRHYCQAYPCGPARASLFTGLYAEQHGVRQNEAAFAARIPTLFTLLRDAGYDPTLFGYTDVADPPRADANGVLGLRSGLRIDTKLDDFAVLWIAYLRTLGYAIPQSVQRRDTLLKLTRFDEPALFDADHSEAAFLTDRFLKWLRPDDGAPFCAHLTYFSPHPPFAAPAPFDKQWSADDSSQPCRGDSPSVEALQHPFMRNILEQVAVGNFAHGLEGLAQAHSLETIRQVKAVYAGQVSEVDAQLGRLFDALRARRQWDNTVVVVTADHGEQLFDHWTLGKTGYFDQSVHVPLIIRLPDNPSPTAQPEGTRHGDEAITKSGNTQALGKGHGKTHVSGHETTQREAVPARGNRVDVLTESIDILPTLLALADITLPDTYQGDGRNLVPLCHGKAPALWRDEVHWQLDFSRVANGRLSKALGLTPAMSQLDVVRTDRLKYVHFAGMSPVLFDLHADPSELVNRADDPGARTLLDEGHARWQTWRDGLDA